MFGGAAALLLACSPGPGRAPAFADAAPRPDSGRDAGPVDLGLNFDLDAGLADSAVGLQDAAPRPSYDFTGIFSVTNAGVALFAREVDDRLSLIVGGSQVYPYVYTGTIDEDGRVSVRSAYLERQGCAEARITGQYMRMADFFVLEHVSCSVLDGSPFRAELRGAFGTAYEPTFSGIYQLRATVIDPAGCAPTRTATVFYGISMEPGTRSVAVFPALGVAAEPTLYVGTFDPNTGAFGALGELGGGLGVQLSVRGGFTRADVHDPPRFVGSRDVLEPSGCSYTVQLDGRRVAAP